MPLEILGTSGKAAFLDCRTRSAGLAVVNSGLTLGADEKSQITKKKRKKNYYPN